MKTYKQCPLKFVGGSDIASLTFRGGDNIGRIDFGSDGAYYAYICGGEVEIGDHYKKVAEGTRWLNIYDDELSFKLDNVKTWAIYRAGMRGCIIAYTK